MSLMKIRFKQVSDTLDNMANLKKELKKKFEKDIAFEPFAPI